jgi:hypothetical protein
MHREDRKVILLAMLRGQGEAVILLAMLQAFQVQRRVLDYHDLYWRLPNPRMRASVALGIGRAP